MCFVSCHLAVKVTFETVYKQNDFRIKYTVTMFSKELTDEDIINIVVNPQPTENLEQSDSDIATKEKEKID